MDLKHVACVASVTLGVPGRGGLPSHSDGLLGLVHPPLLEGPLSASGRPLLSLTRSPRRVFSVSNPAPGPGAQRKKVQGREGSREEETAE